MKMEGEGVQPASSSSKSDLPQTVTTPDEPKGCRRAYSLAFKVKVLSEVEAGASGESVAKRHGFDPRRIRDWKHQKEKLKQQVIYSLPHHSKGHFYKDCPQVGDSVTSGVIVVSIMFYSISSNSTNRPKPRDSTHIIYV